MALLGWTLALSSFLLALEYRAHFSIKLTLRSVAHLSSFTLNTCVLFLLVPFIFKSGFGTGTSGLSVLPTFYQFIILTLTLDFCAYLLHFLSHRIPFLFYFHQVHHSDDRVDTTTGLRMHIVQMIYSLIPDFLFILTFAPSREAYLFYAIFSQSSALIHHGRFGIPVYFDKLFVTPKTHLEHHKRAMNFGSIFSFWDRLFGTFSNQVSTARVGLAGVENPLSAQELFIPMVRVPT